ncbi:hypothetical protein GGI1_04732 [Acidithiobacillus sp. GGI-221]|nr:hypothetical protein GGI1_04732 [Acidithiobacillus sp. GGI-221]
MLQMRNPLSVRFTEEEMARISAMAGERNLPVRTMVKVLVSVGMDQLMTMEMVERFEERNEAILREILARAMSLSVQAGIDKEKLEKGKEMGRGGDRDHPQRARGERPMMPRAKVSVWASGMGTLFHRVHLFISNLGRFAMVFVGAWGSVWDLSLAVFDPRAADYLWGVAAGLFFSFLLDAGAPMTIEVHGRDVTAPAWQVRDYAAAHFPWFGFLFWGIVSLALCLGTRRDRHAASRAPGRRGSRGPVRARSARGRPEGRDRVDSDRRSQSLHHRRRAHPIVQARAQRALRRLHGLRQIAGDSPPDGRGAGERKEGGDL